MLLSSIGPEALERYNNLTWLATEDKDDFDANMTKLATEFEGLKRVVYSRYLFWTSERSEGQVFDEYLSSLKNLARPCEFLEKDNMIRDKIVFSMKSKSIKERLLREVNLTLTRTIDLCRSSEITQKEVKSMKSEASGTTTKDVDAVSAYGKKKSRFKNPKKDKSDLKQEQSSAKKCSKCGLSHQIRSCPAYGKKCNRCGGPNHFRS